MSNAVRLSPLAYIQWKTWCHAGDTEVGAFGVHVKDDPLVVDWLWLPQQECSPAFVQVDEGQWEEFAFDPEVRKDLPGELTPVWLHTHPGSSATPSGYDEDNFVKEYGHERIAVFGIMARQGETYGRLQVGGAKPMGFELDVQTYWSWLPKYSDRVALFLADWRKEFDAKVRVKKWAPVVTTVAPDKKTDAARTFTAKTWDAAKGDWVEHLYGVDGKGNHWKVPQQDKVVTSLLDSDEQIPTFEEYCKDEYDVWPSQFDAATVKGLKDDYYERYGISADDEDESNCLECQLPLDEEEVAHCVAGVCQYCVGEWRSQTSDFTFEDLIRD